MSGDQSFQLSLFEYRFPRSHVTKRLPPYTQTHVQIRVKRSRVAFKKPNERVTSKARWRVDRGRSWTKNRRPILRLCLLLDRLATFRSAILNTVCSPRVSPGHPYAANRLPVSGGNSQSRKSNVSPRFPPRCPRFGEHRVFWTWSGSSKRCQTALESWI